MSYLACLETRRDILCSLGFFPDLVIVCGPFQLLCGSLLLSCTCALSLYSHSARLCCGCCFSGREKKNLLSSVLQLLLFNSTCLEMLCAHSREGVTKFKWKCLKFLLLPLNPDNETNTSLQDFPLETMRAPLSSETHIDTHTHAPLQSEKLQHKNQKTLGSFEPLHLSITVRLLLCPPFKAS